MSNKYAGGVKAGSTSVSTSIVLRSATDGTEVTGKVAADVTASYQRQGAAVTTFAVSNLSTPTSAWAAGGWKEKDAASQPGHFRLDVPDAAWVAGADFVVVAAKVAGCFMFFREFPLETAGAAEVATTLGAAGAGLTALGDARLAHLDADVSAVKAKTDNLPAGFPTRFASLVIDTAGHVSIGFPTIQLTGAVAASPAPTATAFTVTLDTALGGGAQALDFVNLYVTFTSGNRLPVAGKILTANLNSTTSIAFTFAAGSFAAAPAATDTLIISE